MSNLIEYYKILGVSIGAGLADVTTSYKRLCRMYHPDVSSDPESEELMKSINIAYTVLREKFRREASFREHVAHVRQTRRYAGSDYRTAGANTYRAGAEAENDARAVLDGYFSALCTCDYAGAYSHLSGYDKRHITCESFIEWRESVSRLYSLKTFNVSGNSSGATVTFNGGRTVFARKFHLVINEEDASENVTRSSEVEKLVISEHGAWKVFLGYKGVGDLTRAFDEQFEAVRKRDIAKHWEEYYTGLYPEYNMLSLAGMRKAISRELYRQSRYGGTLAFAVISVEYGGAGENGQREQLLRSVAKTILGAIRETDIPAYAGDGMFVVLFVELRKKNAEDIVIRLTKKIRGNAGPRLGMLADIEYAFESWPGSEPLGIDALNMVLKRFHKKL